MMDIEVLSQSQSNSQNASKQGSYIQAQNIGMTIRPPSNWSIFDAFKSTEAPQHPKIILDDVSAAFPRGSLVAILGSSGSGKTSLLKVLSQRTQPKTVTISGNVSCADGRPPRCAYLAQNDFLPATLTVRESLNYSAELRCQTDERSENVETVEKLLDSLRLAGCADTRIGDSSQRGCSGGEKRRTSIATQLLGDAEILCCDEPTTGLDATTALEIIKILKDLALSGLTVVLSIHAPRSDMWHFFDNVVLLSRGVVLYSGPKDDSITHFGLCGYPIPPMVNPAEYLLELGSVDYRSRDSEFESFKRLKHLRTFWEPKISPEPVIATSFGFRVSTQKMTSFQKQLTVLTRRAFRVQVRDRRGLFGIWGGSLAMALINGWIFSQLDESISGIRSRQGSLWDATGLYGYLIMINEICRFLTDLELYDHESQDGAIGSMAFLLSRRAAKLVLEDLAIPAVFTAIYYSLVGYRLSAPQISVFTTVMILTHYVAIAFAGFCAAMTRTLYAAGLLGNLFFSLQVVASGYFLQSNQLPDYVRWFKWITQTYYTFSALSVNEFLGFGTSSRGHFYNCPVPGGPENPACKEYTGAYIVESLGLPHNWLWKPLVILCAIAVLFHLCTGLALHFGPHSSHIRPSVTRTAKGPMTSAAVELMGLPTKNTTPGTVISIHEYQLKRKLGSGQTSHLLGPVSASFTPGKLHVIMGPSGSGKTTLLSSLAGRLSSTNNTKYEAAGSILYDGLQYSECKIKSMVSFVDQEDEHLIPSLTIREILQFTASFKLPPDMSPESRSAQVDSLIQKLGLTECADTQVGSKTVQGVSGGQRRRVSIACAVLGSPQILILDEPTSGLDTFIALSLIETLQSLAVEGRTILISAHQPSAAMIPLFSTMLCLSPGGLPIYSGSMSQMLPYFQSLGFDCPVSINQTDHVMDLATPNPSDASAEERVEYLVKAMERRQNYCPQQPKAAGYASGAPEVDLKTRNEHCLLFRKAFPLVLHRAALNMSRRPIVILARSIQVPGIGVLLALFFAPLDHDYPSVQSRMGLIQQFATLCFVGMTQNMATYPSEREIFYHDKSDKLYGVECFLLQYTTLEAPFEIMSSLIFSGFVVYVIRLQLTTTMFAVSMLNTFCLISCGESISMICNTIFSHLLVSVNIACALLAIFTVLGGVMSLHLPVLLKVLNYISPIKYAIASVTTYSMQGLEFTCTDSEMTAHGTCPIQTGQDVLELYNITQDPKMSLIAVILCTVIYRLVAYFVLKVRMWTLRRSGVSWAPAWKEDRWQIDGETTVCNLV